MPLTLNYKDPVSYTAFVRQESYLRARTVSSTANRFSSVKLLGVGRPKTLLSKVSNGNLPHNTVKLVTNSTYFNRPIHRIGLKFTTYPPVYRTTLGAKSGEVEGSNAYSTPRVHPPLLGSKKSS